MPHFLGFRGFRINLSDRGTVVVTADSPPPSYTPSLDFSDARNSQYLGMVL